MKFNEKIVNIMNRQNSGFHAYQMVINTKTKTLVPLSEVVSIIISGNGVNDITPFTHCGYHFNTTLKGSQYTCYSFHTSHSKFYHNNSIIQNIKYMENGIKFINPLTIMSTYEFNQYFAILNYQSLWPQYHKSINLIEIYNQTMKGAKLALENNNWYIHKNNKIETYNKINDLEVTNEIINNFNEKINDKIYFKQFINHLAEKNEYPKAILKAPVVLFLNELYPTAVLFEAVLARKALSPTATLLDAPEPL